MRLRSRYQYGKHRADSRFDPVADVDRPGNFAAHGHVRIGRLSRTRSSSIAQNDGWNNTPTAPLVIRPVSGLNGSRMQPHHPVRSRFINVPLRRRTDTYAGWSCPTYPSPAIASLSTPASGTERYENLLRPEYDQALTLDTDFASTNQQATEHCRSRGEIARRAFIDVKSWH